MSMLRTSLVVLMAGCTGIVGELNVDSTNLVDGGTCSRTDGAASEITFSNRFTDRTLRVVWLDEQCSMHELATLTPQTFVTESTFEGHDWLVTDADSSEVLHHAPAPAGPTMVVFPLGDTQVCSSVSRTPVHATFRNRTLDQALSLFWVDAACKEHAGADIAPRTTIAQDTYSGHVFTARRAGTNEFVGRYSITESTNVVLIPDDATAPVCSDDGVTNAVVTFTNNYPARSVEVVWVDYKCVEVSLGTLAPAQTLSFDTHYTHAFRLKDAVTHEVVLAPAAISAPVVNVVVP